MSALPRTDDGKEPAALPPAVRDALRLAPAPPVSILLVDDDPRNLLATAEVLREPSWRIVQAKSGDEALRHLLQEEFALVLLDVQMPNLDGYGTAELIRQREKTRTLPIIFVTAVNKDQTHVFRGYAAGAVDYVFKPVDPIILRSKVAVFVDLFRKTEAIRRQAALEARLMQENFSARLARTRAELALQKSEAQQALILKALPIALWVDPLEGGRPGARRFVSGDVEEMLGCKPDELAADPGRWANSIGEEDRSRALAELAAVLESGGSGVEYEWRRPDGETRWFHDDAVLVRRRDGSPKEIVGTLVDITDRKMLEQRLVQAQKMEALGKLTGGIAHDFNNMLSIVIGNLDLLQKGITEPTTARRAKSALEGALRCAEMTQRLLTFARRRPLDTKVIDLGAMVPAIVELLRRTVGERIAIELEIEEGLWPIRSDAAQLEAAIVNLALNARDAMPDGGRIAVKLGNRQVSGIDADIEDGDYVSIAVVDDGQGMAPEVAKRAFEPFFTTKGVGKGTGLGLSTTYGFIKESRGHIAIDSTAGVGTTVSILLPRSIEAPAVAEEAPEREEAAAQGETILVVEDDAEVRELAVSSLSRLGYQVLEAGDAATGLRMLDDNGAVKLLFTDILMPGEMSGRELAREALRRRPELKILYVSGYGGDAETEDGDIVLLRKPYRGDDLAGRIRSMLDTPPSEVAAAE